LFLRSTIQRSLRGKREKGKDKMNQKGGEKMGNFRKASRRMRRKKKEKRRW
jgi:hypothetical protein